ncbi:unnamed protein product [Brassica rapa subsp. trilocularis]
MYLCGPGAITVFITYNLKYLQKKSLNFNKNILNTN